LDRKLDESKKAIIILHEIYGVNQFIKDQCQKFRHAGYNVFCPNMIDKAPFSYEASVEAYTHFFNNIGFEVYKEITSFANELKEKYDHVFMIGFSIGATIAWRCCENALCSGIVACYGSRIRDYKNLTPGCPTLLIFAKEDSFDVHALVSELREKPLDSIIEFDAKHGFLDHYSSSYNIQQAELAEEYIKNFLNDCTK
jgi:dienelactone hydrolase